MAVIDWSRYQQCPVCGAALAKPCRILTGFVAGAQGGVVEAAADEPHGGRKLRTGYARAGGGRG